MARRGAGVPFQMAHPSRFASLAPCPSSNRKPLWKGTPTHGYPNKSQAPQPRD